MAISNDIKGSLKLWLGRLFDLNSECTHVQYRRVDLISRMSLLVIFMPIIFIEMLYLDHLNSNTSKIIVLITSLLFVTLYYLATFSNEVRRFKFREKSPIIYFASVICGIAIICILLFMHFNSGFKVTPMLFVMVMLISILPTVRNSYKVKQDDNYFRN
ncbi:hypothetical protein [Macrococcus sp. DPC7161]|uniref:hypothetical protein n=1 Tax=Macrococcus sp. DPC7161 TaxID=2507060 RepID=UPI00100AC4B5|nr:hypothetical protein [Macrococcus sp. DPC7161]RXK18192.1 hypothetical protein ER639_05750 [Macrococcus sp. DPC7161]